METSASLDLLRQADCDTGQGFLFAKPMPARHSPSSSVNGGVPP
ncbi:hypothetical protein J4732_22435 [Serratia marcescens]|uniref:EAL domain-containing protein n=1 Tax=Serratia marcescens TaxID=615 RepID=A0A939NTG9_SERMA|nr:hypothetical protein [Serratia marcescens]